jgi:single-strand DNA-binding protein
VRKSAHFIRVHCHGPGSGRSYPSFFGLLSRGHGRLSTSPAPWRRGALLLPLRVPPDFRFPPKKIGPAEQHLFRLLQKMQSLAWGAGATCLSVPRERAGQKKEIQIMYQNRISLIGFVGNDVQLKSTKNGTPVAVLSVATKTSWKNGKGEYDSRTEWHRCIAWGKLAEFAGKLEKGAHVQIEGELRYREYKKDRGSDANDASVKHRVAEIHANRILKLDRAAKQDEPAPEGDSAEVPVPEPA